MDHSSILELQFDQDKRRAARPEWMTQDKIDWIIRAASHWRVPGPYGAKFEAELRAADCDFAVGAYGMIDV